MHRNSQSPKSAPSHGVDFRRMKLPPDWTKVPWAQRANCEKLVFGQDKQKELRYDKINRDPYAADSRRPAAVDTGCKPSTFSALLRSYQATGGHHHSARLRLRAMVRRLELHRTTAKLPVPCRDYLHWQWHLSIAGWDLYWQYPTRDGHERLEQCSLSERISVWFFWRDNE